MSNTDRTTSSDSRPAQPRRAANGGDPIDDSWTTEKFLNRLWTGDGAPPNGLDGVDPFAVTAQLPADEVARVREQVGLNQTLNRPPGAGSQPAGPNPWSERIEVSRSTAPPQQSEASPRSSSPARPFKDPSSGLGTDDERLPSRLPPARRPGGFGAWFGDLQIREAAWIKWLIRSTALILPVAAVAGVVVWLALRTLLTATTPEASTVTRIVLTDQVVWPFFDTVVEEVGNVARSDELVVAVGQAFPDADFELNPEVPTNVDAIIDITVVAETTDVSEAVSTTAAQWVIDEHETKRLAEAQQALDPVIEERDRLVEQLDTETNNADTLATQRQLSAGDEAAQERIDRELRVANDSIAFYNREILDLNSSIAEQQGEIDAIQPEVAIGSVNTSTNTESASSLPVQAGVAAFLLATLGLLVFNREHGRFGSTEQLQSVLEIPVVPWNSERANVQLARLVKVANQENECRVIGVDSWQPQASAGPVSDALAALDLPVRYLTPGETPSDPSVIYIQPTDDSPTGSEALKGLVTCDAVVIVADGRRDRIHSLRRRLRRYQDMGIPPLAIISLKK